MVDSVDMTLGSVRIISDVSITAQSGKITGLLGANGSGKSTLLKAVGRQVRPTKGTVWLGERDVWSGLNAKEFAQTAATLGQERGVEVAFSVEDIVNSGRTPHLGPFTPMRRVDRIIATEATERAGISHLIHRQFNTLSGGEKQRVLMARAIAQEPQVLLLDEPTNHLDVKAQFDILELVSKLNITIIIAIHDLTLALQYCDQVHILKGGIITASGPPAEACTPEVIQNAFGVKSAQISCPEMHHRLISLAPLQAESEPPAI